MNLSPRDGAINLRAASTKTGKARVIPIMSRLRALLLTRRNGPDGEPLPAAAHVFGNEVGEPINQIKTAWLATCRRAGIVDLHFHDLRRDFASRLLGITERQHRERARLAPARQHHDDQPLPEDDDRRPEGRGEKV